MKARFSLPVVCAVLIVCVLACASRAPQVTHTQASPDNVCKIALLPVACSEKDAEISNLLEEKLLKELHFKGYPPIIAEVVDGNIIWKEQARVSVQGNVATDRIVQNQERPDAAMQCSILENKVSKRLFYAPVTVSVGCELRSTETGELLWTGQHRTTWRSFDLFRDRLEMKVRGALESALEETVANILDSLPYGPQLRG